MQQHEAEDAPLAGGEKYSRSAVVKGESRGTRGLISVDMILDNVMVR